VVTYILAIVVIAFVFDFINGFHDSANSIATIVGTRVLSPLAAVVWAAVFNFAAILGGTAVAKAVATGFVDPAIVEPNLMCAALLGAIVWNLFTWWFGIPSSSSHALIGGLAGAALAKAGSDGITIGRKWIETLSAMGRVNPFFERAGFVRVGTVRKGRRSRGPHGAYAGSPRLSAESRARSRYSEPVYYVFDNRRSDASVTPRCRTRSSR